MSSLQLPPKKRPRSNDSNFVWTHDDTMTFINIWKSFHSDTRKASHVNADILASLHLRKIFVTMDILKSKIKNLTNKYKYEKKTHTATGSAPSEWPYFSSLKFLDGASVDPIESSFDSATMPLQPVENYLVEPGEITAHNTQDHADDSTQDQSESQPSVSAGPSNSPSPLESAKPAKKTPSVAWKEAMFEEIKVTNEAAKSSFDKATAAMVESNKIIKEESEKDREIQIQRNEIMAQLLQEFRNNK